MIICFVQGLVLFCLSVLMLACMVLLVVAASLSVYDFILNVIDNHYDSGGE